MKLMGTRSSNSFKGVYRFKILMICWLEELVGGSWLKNWLGGWMGGWMGVGWGMVGVG